MKTLSTFGATSLKTCAGRNVGRPRPEGGFRRGRRREQHRPTARIRRLVSSSRSSRRPLTATSQRADRSHRPVPRGLSRPACGAARNGCGSEGHRDAMTSSRPFDDDQASLLEVPDAVARAAGQVVTQAFDRVLSSDLRVTSAAEASGCWRRTTAPRSSQVDPALRRPCNPDRADRGARRAASHGCRGSWWRRRPTVSIGVTVSTGAGVGELQVLAAFLAYRFRAGDGRRRPGRLAAAAKLTLELYLSPRRTPDVRELRLPFVRLARRWIIGAARSAGTRGARPARRSTPRSTSTSRRSPHCRPLDSPESLRVRRLGSRRGVSPDPVLAARLSVVPRGQGVPGEHGVEFDSVNIREPGGSERWAAAG